MSPKPTAMETEDFKQLKSSAEKLIASKPNDDQAQLLGRLTIYMTTIFQGGIMTHADCVECAQALPLKEHLTWVGWFKVNGIKLRWPFACIMTVAMLTKSPVADAAAQVMMRLVTP